MDGFDESVAIMCQPTLNYYVDSCRDGVGGEAQICDYSDFAEGILHLYNNPAICQEMGQKCRSKLSQCDTYDWNHITDGLEKYLWTVCPPVPEVDAVNESSQSPQTDITPLDVNNIEIPLRDKKISEIRTQVNVLQKMLDQLDQN